MKKRRFSFEIWSSQNWSQLSSLPVAQLVLLRLYLYKWYEYNVLEPGVLVPVTYYRSRTGTRVHPSTENEYTVLTVPGGLSRVATTLQKIKNSTIIL